VVARSWLLSTEGVGVDDVDTVGRAGVGFGGVDGKHAVRQGRDVGIEQTTFSLREGTSASHLLSASDFGNTVAHSGR
jgi:hypothetical protein